MENPILQETELGEFLSHIVGGVCVFGLRLTNSSRCELEVKQTECAHPTDTKGKRLKIDPRIGHLEKRLE